MDGRRRHRGYVHKAEDIQELVFKIKAILAKKTRGQPNIKIPRLSLV